MPLRKLSALFQYCKIIQSQTKELQKKNTYIIMADKLMSILIARIFSIKRQFFAYSSIAVLPEFYSSFQTYRLLNIEPNEVVKQEFKASYPNEALLLEKLKQNYDVGFNKLCPAAFTGNFLYQMGRMHMMRLNTGHSLLFRFSKALFYSTLLGCAVAITPFVNTYIFHAKPSTCKHTTIGYYEYLMDKKDPDWKKFIHLSDSGRFCGKIHFD
jgi:hypothetical protein